MSFFPRLCLVLLTLCAFTLTAPSTSAAQRGYDTERLPAHGLKYLAPRGYQWLPTQPTEDWIILKFAKKIADEDRKSVV